MKKYVLIAVFLIMGFICGLIEEVGMEDNVICGEIRRSAGECDPCIRIRGCDGEYYLLFAPLDPKCKFVKIVNPQWGNAHMQCSEEFEGEITTRRVSAYCITQFDSIQCISSCKECTDPCAGVDCGSACFGCDLWKMTCVEGECVKDSVIATNSKECGCGITCESVCRGNDLWSQKQDNGKCVLDELIQANSVTCGYDPCEDHCNNRKKDCGEYGVDCGGGCPYIDNDNDNVEDCMDVCPHSRCNKVDATGCETDVDGDGVTDCDDKCPYEKGDSSHDGCPRNTSNTLLLVVSIGGVAAAAGGLGLAFKGTGSKVAEEASKRAGSKVAEEASKKVGTKVAQEASKRAGTKVAEEVTKRAGSKVAEEVTKRAGSKVAEEVTKGAGSKVAEEVTKRAGSKVAEEASKKVGTKVAEEASKKVGTKVAQEASKKVGTKVAQEASKKMGSKVAEEASKKMGSKVAEAATGAGISGATAKKQKIFNYCPKCGAKLSSDFRFCNKCGHKLS